MKLPPYVAGSSGQPSECCTSPGLPRPFGSCHNSFSPSAKVCGERPSDSAN